MVDFCPIPEEEFMTLHVGIIGSNGFVIASDRLRTWGVKGSLKNPQRSLTEKIYCEGSLVCAFAGYNPKTQFIDELKISQIVNIPFSETNLRKFSEEFFKRNPIERDDEILLGCASDMGRLWQIKVYHPHNVVVCPFTDKATNQAAVNAHFIPVLFIESRRPVEQLIFPAALTIWYGERENNGAIKGLQIVVCKDGALRNLEEAEIADLTDRCSRFHKKVGKLMFGAA